MISVVFFLKDDSISILFVESWIAIYVTEEGAVSILYL